MGKEISINRDINSGRERYSCESSPRRPPLGEAEGSLGRNPGNTGFPRIKYGASLVEPGIMTRSGLLLSNMIFICI